MLADTAEGRTVVAPIGYRHKGSASDWPATRTREQRVSRTLAY